MCVFKMKNSPFLLCVSVIIRALMHTEHYWAVMQQVVLGHFCCSNKAMSQRVITGHLSTLVICFSSCSNCTAGHVNSTFLFLTHTFLFSSTVSSLHRFFLITLLCVRTSRANQAWWKSSPARTLTAFIFLFSQPFLSQNSFKLQTNARLCNDTLIVACITHSVCSTRYFLWGAKTGALVWSYMIWQKVYRI